MKTMAVLFTLFALAIAGCKDERIPRPKTAAPAGSAHYSTIKADLGVTMSFTEARHEAPRGSD